MTEPFLTEIESLLSGLASVDYRKGPPALPADISRIEKTLKRRLPKPYLRFLEVFGFLEVNDFHILGHIVVRPEPGTMGHPSVVAVNMRLRNDAASLDGVVVIHEGSPLYTGIRVAEVESGEAPIIQWHAFDSPENHVGISADFGTYAVDAVRGAIGRLATRHVDLMRDQDIEIESLVEQAGPKRARFGKPVSASEITAMEDALETSLPITFKRFLLKYGGLTIDGCDLFQGNFVATTLAKRADRSLPASCIHLEDIGNGEHWALDLSLRETDGRVPVVIVSLVPGEIGASLEVESEDFMGYMVKRAWTHVRRDYSA